MPNLKDNPSIVDDPEQDHNECPPSQPSLEDPWGTLLKPTLKKDQSRCQTWKEEVENLLIFAGLFSAVVTAFIIESYKTLRPDPADATLATLLHIAARLDNPLNTSLQNFNPADPSTFSPGPTASSIRVNIFWFLSLILSLTTVLVGIVCLQWLREHQRYTNELEPMQSFGVFNMRSEGLQQWYIPQIFTTLPLLLQLALVLFFTGVIDFLIALRHEVAIPVIIVISLSLIFIIVTSSLPTLQALALYLPRWRKSGKRILPRAQCPYKSPQSWAFHQLIMLVSTIVTYVLHSTRLRRPARGQVEYSKFTRWQIFDSSLQNNWLTFDKSWLAQRDADALASQKLLFTTKLRSGLGGNTLYDITRSLFKIVHAGSGESSEIVYRCFEQLSRAATSWLPDKVWHLKENYAFNQYFQALCNDECANMHSAIDGDGDVGLDMAEGTDIEGQYGARSRARHTQALKHFDHNALPVLKHPKMQLLHKQNKLVFLFCLLSPDDGCARLSMTIQQHYADLCIQIMAQQHAELPQEIPHDQICQEGACTRHIELLLKCAQMQGSSAPSPRLIGIAQSFFAQAIGFRPTSDDFNSTSLTNRHTHHFLAHVASHAASNMSKSDSQASINKSLLSISSSVVKHLTGHLESATKLFSSGDLPAASSQEGYGTSPNADVGRGRRDDKHRPDYLFYTASIFFRRIVGFSSFRHLADGDFGELCRVLKRYKEHLGALGNDDLEACLGVPSFSDTAWWVFLDHETKE